MSFFYTITILTAFRGGDTTNVRSQLPGSGCIAALEAEKFLAEEESTVENDLELEKQAKKPEANGDAPEYRSNPLL